MGDFQADVIIVGAGLAGMVAAHEAVSRGRKVLMLDQEAPQSLGGQAFWSLGGLFMVDTPEQRRMGIKDSPELALNDWMGSAQFDRLEDVNPRLYAEQFVDWAAGPMRQWCFDLGMRWFPVVGWAERGGALAHGHGNSVPRFHITWGTGTGVIAPFVKRMTEYAAAGQLKLGFRHRVTGLVTTDGAVTGLHGDVLEDTTAARGQSTSREVIGSFEHHAAAVVLTTGGIGGDHARVRENWPVARLGKPPNMMVAGVPDYVDGKMQGIARAAGAGLINEDRMWHYCEGVQNWNPIWPNHGIRILPGPSSMWFDAKGQRMEAPFLPGFDTLGTLKRILQAGEHSWFILTQKIIEKEFALSGSEQNPDLTDGGWMDVLKARLGKGAMPAVEAFKNKGADFVVADDLETLVAGMNRLTPDQPLDLESLRQQIISRDAQLTNPFSKDAQVTALRGARAYRGDRLIRTAKPHAILDAQNGPLIAVRLNILTRKSLGGLHTDIKGRVLTPEGRVLPGLYAAGEVCGFGGGGYHGYNALEGTFLGGCLFSGRIAGQNA
ncbi:FAD-binding dehydrogenase [Sulfitobacter sp. M57]|uniref:FAD-binding dehydrogenase n=1 Tax=unclassified Sulfitobacter TaxID=196795 RepID=UPI0023E206EC|nr:MULTISPECIES: FAD-binding dehydrogenase [unclassified Sulfitobacter]MDF3412874.1 FAD-binding dehydrogenase [Sulfitobacter sp. KE5]MDF3421842.1 FAD-binding dehydrogenase [Sulfitobacter sp. KE43]MDF3431423.1 FAD-binding dehydrogenase [Sulfitobacter sp. KE42]MDF3457064.1 FAD-binding dehydrogenase [Sulfitobacter sp. S74]MDF3460967.1 FAD-binding dehydrogenase [Sulfitobacter sp. Ks18]